MSTILFVCTANRFRSPLAAIYFAREVVKRGYDNGSIRVSSAGTWTSPGLPAMPTVVEYSQSIGLNLNLHKSRVVHPALLEGANLILVMTSSHKEAITQEFPEHADRVFLLSEAAGYPPFDILDPFGGDNTTVDVVASEIIDIINSGFDSIINLAHKLEKPNKDNSVK